MTEQTITTVLKSLIDRIKCRPGWSFAVKPESKHHWVLRITVEGPDSRESGRDFAITHTFPVPHASYNERSWRKWIFECCRKVDLHELGEWFRVDGVRVFAPMHAPGYSPHDAYEVVTEKEANTDQLGALTGDIRAEP